MLVRVLRRLTSSCWLGGLKKAVKDGHNVRGRISRLLGRDSFQRGRQFLVTWESPPLTQCWVNLSENWPTNQKKVFRSRCGHTIFHGFIGFEDRIGGRRRE